MTASDHLSPQFDNTVRAAAFKASSMSAEEAYRSHPGSVSNWNDRYARNPLAAHIPPAETEHHPDGSITKHPQHGLPSYSRNASVQRPRGVEQVPMDRLESTQGAVSKTHVTNMARRKGTPPPIEVVHHVNQDRYVVEDGNHRAVLALKRGQSHIPAVVTRITQRDKP